MKKKDCKFIIMTPAQELEKISKEGTAPLLYQKLCTKVYEKCLEAFLHQEEKKRRLEAEASALSMIPLGFLLYFAIPSWVLTAVISHELTCRSATSLIFSGILSNVFFLRRNEKIWILSIPLSFFLGFTLPESAYEMLLIEEGTLFFIFGIPFFLSTTLFFLIRIVGRFSESSDIKDVQKAYKEALEHAEEATPAEVLQLLRLYEAETKNLKNN